MINIRITEGAMAQGFSVKTSTAHDKVTAELRFSSFGDR
jgi:hypothetical protein